MSKQKQIGNSLAALASLIQAKSGNESVVETVIAAETPVLSSGDQNIVMNLRNDWGDKIAHIPDARIAQTYRDWSMSDDYQDKASILEWLINDQDESEHQALLASGASKEELDAFITEKITAYEAAHPEPVVDQVLNAEVSATIARATAEPAVIEPVEPFTAIMQPETSRDSDAVGNENTSSIDSVGGGGADLQLEPDVKSLADDIDRIKLDLIAGKPVAVDEGTDDEDLNPELTLRQNLSAAIDVLSQRNTLQVRDVLIDVFARVYKNRVNDEDQLLVQVASAARYQDFLIQMFKILGIEFSTTALNTVTAEVEGRKITFEQLGQFYPMHIIEQAVIAATLKMRDFKASQLELAGLKTQLAKTADELKDAQRAITVARREAEVATSALTAENARQKPVAYCVDGYQVIYIRWPVPQKNEKGEVTGETMYYLTTDTAETSILLTEEVNIKVASLRRTKFADKALRFKDKATAYEMLNKLKKGIAKVAKGSKITQRAVDSAKVISLFELSI